MLLTSTGKSHVLAVGRGSDGQDTILFRKEAYARERVALTGPSAVRRALAEQSYVAFASDPVIITHAGMSALLGVDVRGNVVDLYFEGSTGLQVDAGFEDEAAVLAAQIIGTHAQCSNINVVVE